MKKTAIFMISVMCLFISGCADISNLVSGTACYALKTAAYVAGPILSTVLPVEQKPQESSRVSSQDEERRRREKEQKRTLAEQYYNTGLYAYRGFDYKAAISNFDYALNSGFLSDYEKEQVHLYSGASWYLLRDRNRSAQSFQKAKQLHAFMDAKIFPPEILDFYNNQ